MHKKLYSSLDTPTDKHTIIKAFSILAILAFVIVCAFVTFGGL